jgi:hypothetical protein
MAFGPNGQGSIWPLYFASPNLPQPDRTRDFYFTVRIVAAHIAYTGGWWGDTKAYMLTSKCSVLSDGAPVESKGIQSGRKKVGASDDPPLARDIVDITPATVTKLAVEVSIEVSRRDVASEALNLIASNGLAKAFSLSSGTAAGISAVSSIVPSFLKLIRGDTPPQENFCTFPLDVDVPARDLNPGYYAGLVCRGDNQELKSCAPSEITYSDGALRRNGNPILAGTYIVLEVKCHPERQLSECDSTWRDLYKEATDNLNNVVNRLVTGDAAKKYIDETLGSFVAIQKLMRTDKSFTDTDEASYIAKLVKLIGDARAQVAADH